MNLEHSKEGPRFLNIGKVADTVEMGQSTVLAWESQGKFPRAIRLSPTKRVWLEQDIHNWMMAKHAEAIKA